VPFTFSCSDIDPSCPVKFVSDSDVQLLDQIHRHVADAHPELAKKKPTAEELKKAIKPKV
jgi:predicted small metal-binding protein